MAQRKKIPDVMGELLSGKTGPIPQQNAIMPVKQLNSMPVNQQDDEKVKATYYLSQTSLDALEEAKLQLRRIAGKDKRQISSSAIVEAALRIAFEDFEAEKTASKLASILVNQ